MTDPAAPTRTPPATGPRPPAANRQPPPCAFCDSTNTELIALFGQQLMSSQYYCRDCRSVFEAIRWEEE